MRCGHRSPDQSLTSLRGRRFGHRQELALPVKAHERFRPARGKRLGSTCDDAEQAPCCRDWLARKLLLYGAHHIPRYGLADDVRDPDSVVGEMLRAASELGRAVGGRGPPAGKALLVAP